MPRHHVIISGTGRSGTTFLVQLLTALGLDTGFKNANQLPVLANCNAGLELDVRQEDSPYIVKNPWLCDYIQEVLSDPNIVIDHAFIPIRNMQDAAKSRAYVNETTDHTKFPDGVPGGFWYASDLNEQENVLGKQLYKLIFHLSKAETPITFIHYPRLTQDCDYLYSKLVPLLQEISYDVFVETFKTIVREDLVHQFSDWQPQMQKFSNSIEGDQGLIQQQEKIAVIQSNLKRIRSDKQRLRSKVERLKIKVAEHERELATIKNSKFWTLRRKWLLLKNWLRLDKTKA